MTDHTGAEVRAKDALNCAFVERSVLAIREQSLRPHEVPAAVELLVHATAERFQYRHAWQPGDLVMWDNRCLLHKSNGDCDMDQTRYLYRVMLQGDVPR